jgi:hypothetical protein
MRKLKCNEIIRTTEACPTQWNLLCTDESGFKCVIYGRYRSNFFYIQMESSENPEINGIYFTEGISYMKQRLILHQTYLLDREDDSFMDDEDMKALVKHIISF